MDSPGIQPTGSVLPSEIIQSFLVVVVVQSGFLLDRSAPLFVGALTMFTAGAHITHEAQFYAELEARAELLYGLPVVAAALPVVLHHHERWDGQGYPDGLTGEEIPLAARIFAVCDALDSMTSDRPYRRARPMSVAREEIQRAAGTQFDPPVVEAFLEISEIEWERLRCM